MLSIIIADFLMLCLILIISKEPWEMFKIIVFIFLLLSFIFTVSGQIIIPQAETVKVVVAENYLLEQGIVADDVVVNPTLNLSSGDITSPTHTIIRWTDDNRKRWTTITNKNNFELLVSQAQMVEVEP